ncbi:hypothetical protein [Haloarcula onubensis]|uniref:Uncharacterized protein n=1 Tax=Haloarcula onubensis TaxID=2950539 RepID=A0ABU2FKM3_9EURY|nr:hypothetical protein [Halomicroarcula sp. S3CR25-11]MDS0281268.1 hypothetical protein [Halomicroarcula sp. S3CR25-11]
MSRPTTPPLGPGVVFVEQSDRTAMQRLVRGAQRDLVRTVDDHREPERYDADFDADRLVGAAESVLVALGWFGATPAVPARHPRRAAVRVRLSSGEAATSRPVRPP